MGKWSWYNAKWKKGTKLLYIYYGISYTLKSLYIFSWSFSILDKIDTNPNFFLSTRQISIPLKKFTNRDTLIPRLTLMGKPDIYYHLSLRQIKKNQKSKKQTNKKNLELGITNTKKYEWNKNPILFYTTWKKMTVFWHRS